MRRSAAVLAPLLASTAVALLSGCDNAEQKRCVDEQNHIVNPSFCAAIANGAQTAPGNLGSYYTNGVFFPHTYRYYYGGGSAGIGSIVSGGSYVPLPGHSYSLKTTRGGFGSLFSGGEGE
jgi:hypothetical protein